MASAPSLVEDSKSTIFKGLRMPLQIFISWSGTTSNKLANELSSLLQMTNQSAKIFLSNEDIRQGSRWSEVLNKSLENHHIGLFCLTASNWKEPWINFEAGAIAKFTEKSRVCPIFFGLDPTQISGPLSLFQGTRFNKAEIWKLISELSVIESEGNGNPAIKQQLFEMLWPKFDDNVQSIIAAEAKSKITPPRAAEDMLKEIVDLCRKSATSILPLQAQISDLAEKSQRIKEVVERSSLGILPISQYDYTAPVLMNLGSAGAPILSHVLENPFIRKGQIFLKPSGQSAAVDEGEMQFKVNEPKGEATDAATED